MSFPAYPEYKDSGVPWLGAVPGHWEVGQFKRLVEIQNGADYKHVEADEGYPVIGSGGAFTFASDYLYDGEAVLLGRKGTIDKPLHFKGRFWTVDTMYWAKIRPEACGRFAFYAALTIPFTYYSTSTALPSMTQGSLNAHMVALPSEAEQAAIAAFLDRETAKIDALVAEQERLIALLKEKRQAVISHAVTKGLNPHAPMKDSGIEWLGEIPAHWAVRPIRKLATLESGHTPSRSRPEYWVEQECTIPWVTTGDVKHLRDGRAIQLHTTAVKISPLGLANSSARLLPKDTVFLSRTASVGFSGIMADDMAVSQDFAAWICGDELLPAYLLFCLRSMSSVFASLMIGSTHKTIYMPDIEALVIPHPPVDEQQRIVDFILSGKEASEGLLDSCQAAITLLQERRAALISAAVTGKIDVRGLVDAPATAELETA